MENGQFLTSEVADNFENTIEYNLHQLQINNHILYYDGEPYSTIESAQILLLIDKLSYKNLLKGNTTGKKTVLSVYEQNESIHKLKIKEGLASIIEQLKNEKQGLTIQIFIDFQANNNFPPFQISQTIIDLRMPEVNLKDENCESLVSCLPKLKRLDIRKNPLITSNGVSHFKRLQSLKQFVVGDNRMSQEQKTNIILKLFNHNQLADEKQKQSQSYGFLPEILFMLSKVYLAMTITCKDLKNAVLKQHENDRNSSNSNDSYQSPQENSYLKQLYIDRLSLRKNLEEQAANAWYIQWRKKKKQVLKFHKIFPDIYQEGTFIKQKSFR